MGRRRGPKVDGPIDLGASPPGAYGKRPKAAPPVPAQDDLGALSPIFAWFEGGDRIQFGDLCPSCPEDVKNECRAWRRETMDGIAATEPKVLHRCPFFIKWEGEALDRKRLTPEELKEGARQLAECPSCKKGALHAVNRTSSEFGTRMNPRMVAFHWCDCGHFSAERRELHGDRERCVFCGSPVASGDGTVHGGILYHIECFLRLRFFFTMNEMFKVAQGYALSGKPLTVAESEQALRKTLHMVRAFRFTGNDRVIGISRVIHWLEGQSPLITDRTVLRTRPELSSHLASLFKDENERSVGLHILEDAYIVYGNAPEVRWITHGVYRPAGSVRELLDSYIDPARKGDWKSMEGRLVKEIEDGKCALCGAVTRSHRIASGEDEKNMYVCHHCWTKGAGSGQ